MIDDLDLDDARAPLGPTAREIRAQVPDECRRRSTLKALSLLLPLGLLYAATVVATVVAPLLVLRLAAAGANAFLLSLLFVVGHDACHGALTPSRRLNAILGRLALLPSWHPFSGWEHAHNHMHHTWTNLRSKDYAWAPLSKAEYDDRSPWSRWLIRASRSIWGFGPYYFLVVYLQRTIFPGREFWGRRGRGVLVADCLLVVAFIALQVVALLALNTTRAEPLAAWSVLLVGLVLPFIVWNWLIGFLIFLHHTHPQVPWFDDRREWSFYGGQVQGTVHVVFPWGINALIQHIMEHTAHHADPRIPLYELATAQRSLERAYSDDIVIHFFSWSSLRQTLRVCQLYDFAHHRWLSYAGERTSGPTIATARPLAKPLAVAR